MFEIIVSSSSNSDERETNEYHDESSSSGSSISDSSSNSSNNNGRKTTDEQYLSRVPRVSLEVPHEEMRTRMTSGSLAGTSASVPSSTSSSEEEILYCCAVGVPSKTDESKLNSLRSWYQILDNLNPRLAICGESCCNPHFGLGIYEAYLLGGLRLPFNAFAREILHRLGIGINQPNPNAWRLIISTQILRKEVFLWEPSSHCRWIPIYCYKPS